MRCYKLIFCAVLLIGIVGCADMRGRDIGMATGGIAGAALGSQLGGSGIVNAMGAAGGAVLGGFVGRQIGKASEGGDQQPTTIKKHKSKKAVSDDSN